MDVDDTRASKRICLGRGSSRAAGPRYLPNKPTISSFTEQHYSASGNRSRIGINDPSADDIEVKNSKTREPLARPVDTPPNATDPSEDPVCFGMVR